MLWAYKKVSWKTVQQATNRGVLLLNNVSLDIKFTSDAVYDW
jgi:hypothetical protein